MLELAIAGGEVPEQTLERFFVRRLILPGGEVPHVPGPPEMRCPSCLFGHHGLVGPNREQHQTVFFVFFLQGRLDFLFDPGRDGVSC